MRKPLIVCIVNAMDMLFPPIGIPPNRFMHPALKPLWAASGIDAQKGNKSWIYDQREGDEYPRAQSILLFAAKPHIGLTKKFGPRPLTSHQILGMHRIANYPDLERMGINRFLAIFLFGAHDCVEDMRFSFEKILGKEFTPLDEAKAYAEIFRILDEPAFHEKMRACQKYVTDDPKLTGDARIQAQIDKSFNPDGTCKIPALWQLVRAIDKIEQLSADVWARQNNFLPDEKLEAQLKKAEQKSYILRFPLIAANKEFVEEYRAGLSYLRDQLQQVHDKKAARTQTLQTGAQLVFNWNYLTTPIRPAYTFSPDFERMRQTHALVAAKA